MKMKGYALSGAILAVLWTSLMARAGEVELPPRGEGALAFEVDACSFRWQEGGGYEEVVFRFPIAQLRFLRQASGVYLARYRPALRVLNEAGEVAQRVEAESRMEVDSIAATGDARRMFMDMVQVRLPPGRYRGELTLSDLQGTGSGQAVFPMEVPAYETGRLGMSDLYLASGIDPEGAGKGLQIFRKGDHLLLPNPSRTYPQETPLLFYFEVYHLGRQAHRVQLQVLDPYGHAVWQDRRDFPGYREEARFVEGAPLRGLPPGTYTLRAEVTAGPERVVSERRFEVSGEAPLPAEAFDRARMEAGHRLLERYDPAAAAVYERLDRTDRGCFLYGFWTARNAPVARAYYGPLLGYGGHQVSGALLRALGLSGVVARRVDQAYADRLARPDTAQAQEALEIIKGLLKEDGGDPLARAALGYVRLEQGALAEAERAFEEAMQRIDNPMYRIDNLLPEVLNGVGLAKMGRRDWARAEVSFERALALRPGPARVNLALCRFLAGQGDPSTHSTGSGQAGSGQALKEAAEADPNHPEVFYIQGRIHERRGELKDAGAAYARQVAVNPTHARARYDLGRVCLKQGRRDAAVRAWRELMEARPDFRGVCLLSLLEAYQQMGETGAAQQLMSEHLRTLDEGTRALVEDVRLVATPEEARACEALSAEARPGFVRAFWQGRDPTPATPGNERLVEHYRRVLYAMQHFSGGRRPWDRRGEVYIRYGEPAHRSRAGDVRYETDPAAVRVKERLWMSIPQDGRKEIVARMNRLRTSFRDVEVRDVRGRNVDVSDFESVEFELNPNRPHFGATSDEGSGDYRRTTEISHLDRGLGTESIRGYPLFPVDGGTQWEYWIYPDVAGGIEVVFVALSVRGEFDYPDLPQGRALSDFNAGLWAVRRPDRVVASAVRQQGDAYRPQARALNFHFDTADFRGEGGKSRLEVYYGVPLAELPEGERAGGRLERGLALFDSLWTPVFRKVEPMPYQVGAGVEREAGTLLVDQAALNLPPGRYRLGVQVRDPEGGLEGAYTRELEVEDYAGRALRLSDIELAGEVVEDPAVREKGGRRVTPLPSATYRPGQSVMIYYEVYGLTPDASGRTRYRMDYRIVPQQGRPVAVRVLRAVGRLLGIEQEKVVTISYEQTGEAVTEFNYLEIDVSGSKGGRYELGVTVTDLNSRAQASKKATFQIGD
jgi:GWxTD domain-containing protein